MAREQPVEPVAPQTSAPAWEMLLFLAASAVGIFALGSGLHGVFGSGGGFSFAWLAVAGVCVWILSAQMGRVHDAWPRRTAKQRTAPGEAVNAPRSDERRGPPE